MGLREVNGQIVDSGDPKVRVHFYEQACLVGPGEYEARDYICIRPVSTRDHMSRLATEEDRENYPEEWAAYQAGANEDDPLNTPLTALPGFRTHVGLALGSLGITTVSQLAACEESPVKDGETLLRQAKFYVRMIEEEDHGEVSTHGHPEGEQDHDPRRQPDCRYPGSEGIGQGGLPRLVREEAPSQGQGQGQDAA